MNKNVIEQPIEELLLNNRITNILKADSIHYVGSLLRLTERDLLKVPNCGKQTVKTIKLALQARGLVLGKLPEINEAFAPLPPKVPTDLDLTRSMLLKLGLVVKECANPQPFDNEMDLYTRHPFTHRIWIERDPNLFSHATKGPEVDFIVKKVKLVKGMERMHHEELVEPMYGALVYYFDRHENLIHIRSYTG